MLCGVQYHAVWQKTKISMQLQYLNCSASHSKLTASHAFVLVEIATVTYSMSIITVPLQKLYYDGLSFERMSNGTVR